MASWRRTWWVVFFANLITAVGMMSFLPFFPGILERLGVEDAQERAVWAGVLFGAAPLAAAFMGPVWGSIGDRFGRKLMVVRALLAIALFVGAMSLARTPGQLLALRLGQGVFSGFIPPSITLVSVLTPRAIQGRVTGSLQAALPIGAIIGPLAGGAIQSSLGTGSLFVFVSIAAGSSALLVVLFAEEDPSLRVTVERFSPTSLLAIAMGDLGRLLARKSMRRWLLIFFCVQFGMGATNPLLQLFVESLWDGDPARVEPLTAWLFSAFAMAGVLSVPLWGRIGDRIGHGRALAAAALFSAVFLIGQAAALAYFGLLLGRIAIGLSAPGSNAAAFGLVATETADEERGSAFGAVFSTRAFAVSLGAMSGGLLSSFLTIRGLFLGSGILIALILALPVSSPPRAPRG